jgi:serine/threonine protein kinase/tetratricopeptide (TPR) repeat protein
MLGETIAHYQVTGRIGAGGMGVVYKAWDTKLERNVALKFLSSEVELTQSERTDLLREARAASALDHPNIGAVYGLEESPDHRLFMVMPYYDGETLGDLMSRRALTPAASLDLLIQIAKGLSAAHARNIVHRDIKPTNIIVTRDGVAKIVDFGLARVFSASMTQSRHIAGTIPYMAPEQMLGDAITPACDVWALGVMLVELFTGKHPFFRDSNAAMSFAIVNQPPAEIESLPVELRPIAYKALAKRVEHRYHTAKEFLADLEAVHPSAVSQQASGPDGVTRTKATSAIDLRKAATRASTPMWNAPAQKRPLRMLLVAASAVIALCAASLLLPQVRQRFIGHTRENHIAVLPFDNIGNDPENDAVAEGLMDAMTSELSNLSSVEQSLWVVPASVVRSRKINDPSTAARDLGATLVVKGSIHRAGQSVHLTVDLIDAKNLRQVGSTSLEDRAGDIASLQNEAVARLARLMNIKVSADMLRATGGSVVPAAYEGYLQALGLVQRYDKPGNLDKAIAVLNTAIRTDPRFALGYAQLGEAYRLKYQVDVNRKWLDEAKANCQKAIELDDHSPVAYVTLGRIHEKAGDHDLAVQEFQRALALDQRDGSALAGMAASYEAAGRIAEAEAAYKRAAALRPDYWDVYNDLALFYDRQNKYPEALENIRKAVQLTPDNAQAYSNYGAILIDTGDAKLRGDAEQALKKSIDLSPSYAVYANLGTLYFDTKRYGEAAATYEKALQLNSDNYLVWLWLMNSYEWLGDTQKATNALERAFYLASREAKLNPRDASANITLASLYAKKKNSDKALGHLQTALALSPDDPDVLETAAATSELLGDRSRAISYTEKALQKGYSLDKVKNDHDLQAVLADAKFSGRK